MRHRPALCALLTTLVLTAPVAVTPAGSSPATPRSATASAPLASAPIAGRTAPVQVTVTVTREGIRRSATGFRPGNTMFNVRSAGGGGSVELVRLRGQYTVKRLMRDIAGIFEGDVEVIRRVNRKAVFYGGIPVERGAVHRFGADLEAGRYHLVNLDRGTSVPLRVRGERQRRAMPVTTGPVNYVPENRFWAPRRITPTGWLRQTNKTDEVHFTALAKVKWSVTARKIRRYLESGAQGEPRWALPDSAESLLLSPGRSFVWRYDVSPGKYVALCWYPDEQDGMPHALMGMWRIVRMTSRG